MDYRNLGRTGLKVSELCMGTMQFGWTCDEAQAYEILTASFEAGLNFLDTADIYSMWAEDNPGGVAETIIGKWLKKTGIPREQVVIATKVRGRMGQGPNDEGLSRLHILQAVETSLRRLDTDYIDLYQTHFYDEATPIEETLSALDDLVRQGKVRYIGCSNYPAWRLMQALWASDRLSLARFDSLQPHYHLLGRQEFEQELAEVCLNYGIGVIPYSPLAGGFLSGKYRRGETPDPGTRAESSGRIQGWLRDPASWTVLEKLRELGVTRGRSPLQIALGWLLSRPSITSPIIGPRSLPQLEENLGAVGLRLDEAERKALDEVSAWS